MEKYIVLCVSMQQEIGERTNIIGVYNKFKTALEYLEKDFNETVKGWEDVVDIEDVDYMSYEDGCAYVKYEDDEFFWEIRRLEV